MPKTTRQRQIILTTQQAHTPGLPHLWLFTLEREVILEQMSHCGECVHKVMLVEILHLKGKQRQNTFFFLLNKTF